MHPDRTLKVYFMVYDNSIEENKYLSLIRKEKAAFEKLIIVLCH
jgi:DNA excision repair protein ERCC-4